MRLTCPNCGAQYEVPDEVIPETGRDVQCSNCGDTWFQHHPDHQPEDPADEAEAEHPGWDSPEEESEPETAPQDEPDASAEGAEDEPEHEPETEEAGEAEHDEDDGEPEFAGEEADAEPESASAFDESDEGLKRRELDRSVTDVLREEAAREQEARKNEGSGDLETQPDLGLDERLDDEDQRSQQAKSRMARMRGLPENGIDDSDEPATDPGMISRRNLLPDIDEINSSLDSESTRAEMDHAAGDAVAEDDPVARKINFNRGFMRSVLLVLVLVLLYLLGPVISEKVPALAGVMQGYVDTVNAGRHWLNDMVGGPTAPQ